MTLAQLIAQFRVDADDAATPCLFSDAHITGWLNEAAEEAANRALLIHDVSTTAVCRIAVTAGVAVYPVHTSVINITRCAFTPTDDPDTEYELYGTTEYELDRLKTGWRSLEEIPGAFIHKDTSLRLSRLPPAGTLNMEVNRLPLALMATGTDTPEMAAIHHRHLVQWALHRAFSIPDTEAIDPQRAAIAEREFTRVFGLRPDADARRRQEYSRPHHNLSAW